MNQTKESINEYAKRYDTTKDFDRFFIDFRFRCLKEHYPELGDVLELGCANGLMTKKLLEISKKLDVVDGAEHYIEETKKYLGGTGAGVRSFYGLFMNYEPDKKYDAIILSSILHEVDDPVGLLKKVREWMKNGAVIHINVPNAASLHRRVGRIMGMIKDEHEFSERDVFYDTQRVYDLEKLEKDVRAAGFKIIKKGGYFLKPASNSQMDGWDRKLIDAFYEVGKEVPAELCAEIYIFASL